MGCVRMWLEYIRYRFRLNEKQNGLQLTQVAALRALRNSPRCRSWRVLPAPSDPSSCTLEIEWDPGASLTPFRGSEEFAQLHAVLDEQVKALEEADYRANSHLLQRILGGPEALFRLAEDIVLGIMEEPALRAHFHSDDGSRRGRLGLWLLEVLGGPDLFSSSFPTARLDRGPLADVLLDLEERELLLEIAREALPSSLAEQGLCVLGSLRAHVPLHPPRPSASGARLLEGARPAAVTSEPSDGSSTYPASATVAADDEPASHQRALAPPLRPNEPAAASPRDEPPSAAPRGAISGARHRTPAGANRRRWPLFRRPYARTRPHAPRNENENENEADDAPASGLGELAPRKRSSR